MGYEMGAEQPTWDFTIIIEDGPALTDEIADAIYEAGGDDATVSECGGEISITFARQAESGYQALRSAMMVIHVVFGPNPRWRLDQDSRLGLLSKPDP